MNPLRHKNDGKCPNINEVTAPGHRTRVVRSPPRLTLHLFFLSEVYLVRFFFCSYCVYSFLFVLFCFPPELIFRSRVVGAHPVTTACIVAMSSYENNYPNSLEHVGYLYATFPTMSLFCSIS